MSRAYRVTVRGSVHRVVHVEDGVCSSLELLPILPPERTSEILEAELVRRGFEKSGDVLRRKEEGGVVVEIDPKKATVSVKAEATANIDVEREAVETVVEEALEKGTAAAQKRVDLRAERDAAEAEEKARAEVTEKLERRLGDLRSELDGVTNRVTAEALKEKARKLGEIEELHEDAETGELTIKVKL
ncbi:MAG: hypothetical protein KIT84_36700 [Labilithrix sp.]|nr:hypothetical protein [Labilithrix sp.]MCW5816596.1 hypothetical protein [Labilithrix sp.]